MKSIAVSRAPCAASKTAAAALAVYLLAGPASAAALCARPQDMTALQAAALRQELMVAALTCRAADDFNLFVTAYRDELLKSDRALKDFFLRQDASKGEDAYNAYKTQLANASSLRSLHDPQFCRSAKVAFDVALKRKGALAALASERPRPIATGYAICSPDVAKTEVAEAAPSVPARRLALLDSPPPVPIPKLAPRPLRVAPPQRVAAVVADAAPIPAPTHWVVQESLPSVPVSKMAALQDRALTQGSPQRDSREIDAYDRQADARIADGDGERDDFDNYAADERDDADNDALRYASRYADAQPARAYGRSDGSGSGYGNGSYANYDPGADRGNYNAPYGNLPDAYRPGAYWVDAEGPPARPRMVRGPDGHWYLLLYFGH